MARSLKGIALVVTFGTLLSKVGGLVRQLVIAAAFGVGAAYDAYNYAYVLPGFLLILLGGINGPFHSAMVSVLSRRPRNESAHILAALNTSVSALLLLVTVLLVLAADLVTKQVMLDWIFDPPRRVPVLPFLDFVPVWNPGISFGMLASLSLIHISEPTRPY